MSNEPMYLAGVLRVLGRLIEQQREAWGVPDGDLTEARAYLAQQAERTEQPVAWQLVTPAGKRVGWKAMPIAANELTDEDRRRGWTVEYAYAHHSGLIAALRGLVEKWRKRESEDGWRESARTAVCADELDRIIAAHEGEKP